MNTAEVTMLLTRIQVLDNRQVDALTIEAWEDVLGAVDYRAAVDAVNAHFRESPEYLKPAHITQRIRGARAALTTSAERPECRADAHRRLPDGTCMLCTHRERDGD